MRICDRDPALPWYAYLEVGASVVIAHGGYGPEIRRELGKVVGFTKIAIKVQAEKSPHVNYYSRRTAHAYCQGSGGGSYQGWLENLENGWPPVGGWPTSYPVRR